MQNTVQIYERKYNNIFDTVSEIGGIVQSIFYIFYWINFYYNKYIVAFDTNKLFFTVRGESNTKNGNDGLNFDNFKRKNLNYIPKTNHRIKENINNIVDDKKILDNKKIKNDKIKYQNYCQSKITNVMETNQNIINDKNFNKYNQLYRKVNPNKFLEERNNIENIQKINESNIIDNKTKVNNKDKDNSNEYALNKMTFLIENLDKIQHKKKKSINIKDSKLKQLEYFSYIDFLKTLIFKKEKESHNFLRIFRKHLLSEEHLFKSHIKIIFLEKQHNFNGEEKTNALECFNEL